MGCDRPRVGRGWCRMHYGRWRSHGDPNMIVRVLHRGTAEQRFWAKVDRSGPVPDRRPDLGECWIWRAWVDRTTGYGLWTYVEDDRKVTTTAHAFAYRVTYGAPPVGLHHDHLCHVRTCCRPSHLEAVTQAENNRRSPKLARRTECKRGHSYAEHGYTYPSGAVACRTCNRDAQRAWRSRRRLAGLEYS